MNALDSAERKLGRAKVHREELDSILSTFYDSDPYFVTAELDVERGVYEEVVHCRVEPDLAGYGLVIGDVASNLRSCLNYLAYDLTVLETQANPPPRDRNIQFPIVSDGKEWENSRKGLIPNVGGKVSDAIQSVQPYKRGHADPSTDPDAPVESHPLWWLNELNNADKHRLIPVTTALQGGARHNIYSQDIEVDAVSSPGPLTFGPGDGRTLIPLEEGAVLSRWNIRVTGPNPKVHMEGKTFSHVCLSCGPVTDSALLLVDLMIRYVEEDVFGAIRWALGA